jgi:hypothetical protein
MSYGPRYPMVKLPHQRVVRGDGARAGRVVGVDDLRVGIVVGVPGDVELPDDARLEGPFPFAARGDGDLQVEDRDGLQLRNDQS